MPLGSRLTNADAPSVRREPVTTETPRHREKEGAETFWLLTSDSCLLTPALEQALVDGLLVRTYKALMKMQRERRRAEAEGGEGLKRLIRPLALKGRARRPVTERPTV